jgi:hypothetical protein
MKKMKLREVKEQLQEDILSILEGFGIDEAMDEQDYERIKNAMCDAVIANLDKISEL